MRGAWIEIYPFGFNLKRFSRRSPCGGAWIEMNIAGCPGLTAWSLPMRERGLKCQSGDRVLQYPRSLPMRGAWIEMRRTLSGKYSPTVAPHAGGVD